MPAAGRSVSCPNSQQSWFENEVAIVPAAVWDKTRSAKTHDQKISGKFVSCIDAGVFVFADGSTAGGGVSGTGLLVKPKTVS